MFIPIIENRALNEIKNTCFDLKYKSVLLLTPYIKR